MLWTLTKRLSLGLFAGEALSVAFGFLYQTISTELEERQFPPIGKMVDMDGFRLHLNSSGKIGPTVVLDSGLGSYSLDWALVQPAVAQFARVCSYDRAGLGWSDESLAPRSSANMVEELHTLLERAEIPKPYILVGHSLGGVNVCLFATLYLNEVAGVVLVDAAHEDQFEKMPKLSCPNETLMLLANKVGIIRFLRYYFQYQSAQLSLVGKLPADVHPIRNAQIHATKVTRTIFRELSAFETSLSELKRTGGHLGDIPLIVITAMQVMSGEGLGIDQQEMDNFHKVFLELQKDLLNKSTKSTQILAEESDHSIPLHQPAIVVDAIRSLIENIQE